MRKPQDTGGSKGRKMKRSEIYSALYSRLSSSLSAVCPIVGMQLRDWTATVNHPAVFLSQEKERRARESSRPIKWLLRCTAYVYVREESGADGCSTLMDGIVGSIQSALLASPGEQGMWTTLSGAVDHARVAGVRTWSPETDVAQQVAQVEIELLTHD